MEKEVAQIIAKKLNLKQNQVSAALKLLNDKNTVPFIARYRKDATDGLKDFEVFDIEKQLHKIQDINNRKATILKTIDELGELTPLLSETINNCWEEK